ncbi:MAG: radical SAM protein [Planctomycetota bacterium]|nr:MAG: radical SAM protein [Planctomycetota bacterium]REJ95435.1 MAG: radical SAM protein [Planctomycetota bacterium]REK24178.1 MAG: radical SAM protein [Planctomycetota bacterium]REK28835.1 MAG: radical SAM protein [Planctomycetota bacterium]
MNLSVLYRGPLTSCNYSCEYCPFAKRTETKAQLRRDQQSLVRFTRWIESQRQHAWKVLLTPWGEALVRAWYRDAIVALTQVRQLESVAVQTNLSCGLDWIEDCRRNRLALWATFHPTEADAGVFRRKVRRLHNLGVRVCVGMVGVPEFLEAIMTMRRELPPEIYLWINAQQPRARPYTPDELKQFRAIDPHFELTLKRQPSRGLPCRTGKSVFCVDGRGDMRRCHFVHRVIGNIYDPTWEHCLHPRSCPNRFCDCFLGKAQLTADSLHEVFGENLLERLPLGFSTPRPSR